MVVVEVVVVELPSSVVVVLVQRQGSFVVVVVVEVLGSAVVVVVVVGEQPSSASVQPRVDSLQVQRLRPAHAVDGSDVVVVDVVVVVVVAPDPPSRMIAQTIVPVTSQSFRVSSQRIFAPPTPVPKKQSSPHQVVLSMTSQYWSSVEFT